MISLSMVVEAVLGVAGLAVGIHVGVWSHEWAHVLVARYYGLDATPELDRGRRVPIYLSGECVIRPYKVLDDVERLPTRVSRHISMAPFVVLTSGIALAGVLSKVDLGPLVSAPLLGAAAGLLLCGLPSDGDKAAADHNTRLLDDVGRKYAIRRHGFAEGAEVPSAESIVADAVELRTTEVYEGSA